MIPVNRPGLKTVHSLEDEAVPMGFFHLRTEMSYSCTEAIQRTATDEAQEII
jgi:hypothetical protein